MGKLLAGVEGKSLWRKILWGVVSEGLIEEAPQSAMETVVTILAKKTLTNPDQEIMEGVGEALVGGAVSGGVMGGGMTVISRNAGVSDAIFTGRSDSENTGAVFFDAEFLF